MLRFASWLSPALFLLSTSLSADVLVADAAGAPGATHSGSSAIVNAVRDASEGDTILIRPGTYTSFFIDGKSLTLVADGPGAWIDDYISIGATWAIFNLAADQEVVVRGLTSGGGVLISGCEGPVWLDAVQVTGDVYCSSNQTYRMQGADVRDSANVTFTRCLLRGVNNDYFFFWQPSSNGLRVANANVYAFDSEIVGGWGRFNVSPAEGGAGLRLESGTATVIGCTLEGGPGGYDPSDPCGGVLPSGGPGVDLVGPGGTLYSAETTAQGGQLDLDLTCPGLSGPRGVPVQPGGATIVPLPDYARQLEVNAPLRGGEILQLSIGGRPGDLPLVLVSMEQDPLPLWSSLGGVLLVGDLVDQLLLPTLGASGETSLSIPLPQLGPGVDVARFVLQAMVLDAGSAVRLGAGANVIVLDSSF